MALPVGNLFVDPNIKLVAPELPVDEMKYVWDTKQKVYDQNLADVTKIGMLAKNTKGTANDTEDIQNVVNQYKGIIGQIASKGDYENQTLGVNALAEQFYTDPKIQKFSENYELQKKEEALINEMRAKGLKPLDFGKSYRQQFKTIQRDEQGNEILQTYTPKVEEQRDWTGRITNLVSGIAGDTYDIPPSVWANNEETIKAIKQGKVSEVSPTKIARLVNDLLPTYIQDTPEGRQHFAAYSQLDEYKDYHNNPTEAIRKDMLAIARKQQGKAVDYSYSNFENVPTQGGGTSPVLPPYVQEGQPTVESDKANIGKVYKDLSDAYYDAAKGNTAAFKTAKQIESEFLQINGQKKTRTGKTFNQIVNEREQLIKSLKLKPEDEATLRAEINDLNISYTPGEERMSKFMPSDITRSRLRDVVLARTDLFKGPEKLKELDQTLNQLMGQDIYDVEAEINSFANKGYAAPAYSRVPLVFVGQEGQEAQKVLVNTANNAAVKQSLSVIGEPDVTLENAEIVSVTPFTRPDPKRGVVFKIEYKTGSGTDAKTETKDVYVKRTSNPANWRRNPLLDVTDKLTGGAYDFMTADMAAEFGSVQPGQTLQEVIQTYAGRQATGLAGANKFKFDYQDNKFVVNHINKPSMKLSIETLANQLTAAVGDPRAKPILLSLLASRQGFTNINDPLLKTVPAEFDDPNEVDQVLYKAMQSLR